MGHLRESLPTVPFLAVTATASPKVRLDIANNLRLHNPKWWVKSFERDNLHLDVRKRTGGTIQQHFAPIIKQKLSTGRCDPTVIYTISRADAEKIAHDLEEICFGGKVGMYHGGAHCKGDVHAAFLADDLEVVVATVAFGMGIDKSNIRRVIHYGVPATVEAYYQQIGRAGRDGLPSECTLMWSDADWSKIAFIKGPGDLSAAGKDNFEKGKAIMQEFCHTSECRHAFIMRHFDPDGSHDRNGPCRGGCDNCDRRKEGNIATRDLAKEAALLLSTVACLRGNFGIGRALGILRGSKEKGMKPWMLTGSGPDGKVLYGAGSSHSKEWWKALAGMLMVNGLLSEETRKLDGGAFNSTFSAAVLTSQGHQYIQRPGPLNLSISKEMQELETSRAQAASLLLASSFSKRGPADEEEEQRLFVEMTALRKELANHAQIAPINVCNDSLLRELARKRPAQVGQLAMCEGANQVFRETFGKAFVDLIVEFCKGSSLQAGVSWSQSKRACGAAWANRNSYIQQGAEGASADMLLNLIGNSTAAQHDAYRRFCSGETVHSIATTGRLKPIQVGTVIGYIACAAAGVDDMTFDWEKLASEARLTEPLAHAVCKAIHASGGNGVGAVKEAATQLPDGATCDYSHVKLVAALMIKGAMMFSSSPAGQGDASALAPPLVDWDDEGFGLVDPPGNVPSDSASERSGNNVPTTALCQPADGANPVGPRMVGAPRVRGSIGSARPWQKTRLAGPPNETKMPCPPVHLADVSNTPQVLQREFSCVKRMKHDMG
eukprot:jgi/Botrbrau1/13616/Bobra.0069s0013.2